MKKPEQLTTEDWKEIYKEQLAKRKEIRDENTELVYDFCFMNQIRLEEKTEFHFRLHKEGFEKVDVYPTSSKVAIPKGKQRFIKVDLSTWLPKYFKIKS